MKTINGKIDDLNVQSDRDVPFNTELFEQYPRSIGIVELVIATYSRGVPTTRSADMLYERFRIRNSRSTISSIIQVSM